MEVNALAVGVGEGVGETVGVGVGGGAEFDPLQPATYRTRTAVASSIAIRRIDNDSGYIQFLFRFKVFNRYTEVPQGAKTLQEIPSTAKSFFGVQLKKSFFQCRPTGFPVYL